MLEWLSFSHRYVPVGLLERPAEMDEKPPRFRGRNEMETLLAGSSATDWLKISEMFLGPAPDNFVFIPKHKANAWETPTSVNIETTTTTTTTTQSGQAE